MGIGWRRRRRRRGLIGVSSRSVGRLLLEPFFLPAWVVGGVGRVDGRESRGFLFLCGEAARRGPTQPRRGQRATRGRGGEEGGGARGGPRTASADAARPPAQRPGHPHPGLPQAACISPPPHLFPPRRGAGVVCVRGLVGCVPPLYFSSDGPPALRGMAWRLLHYIVCVVVRTLALQAPL